MKTVLVDTNIVSYAMRGSSLIMPYGPVMAEFDRMVISFATLIELRYGAAKKQWGGRRLQELEDYLNSVHEIRYPDENLCNRYVSLRIYLESRGITIGAADLWIAATALELDCPLVSHNAKHFRDIPGLQLLTSEGK